MSKVQNAIDRNPCSWPAILAKKHSRFGHINMLTRPRRISIKTINKNFSLSNTSPRKNHHIINKKKMRIAGHKRDILIPWRRPLFSALKISLDKISDPKINRKGERGSPCRRPREGMNFPKGAPSIIMEKVVVIHCLIH
jgi:hypothetical protein